MDLQPAQTQPSHRAICSQFAQVVAGILVSTSVRVDVVAAAGGATGSAHSYVLLGRAGDDVYDFNAWGAGVHHQQSGLADVKHGAAPVGQNQLITREMKAWAKREADKLVDTRKEESEKRTFGKERQQQEDTEPIAAYKSWEERRT